MQLTRLNKYLSEIGYCSRREADKLIEERRIKINGDVAKMGVKISLKEALNGSTKYKGKLLGIDGKNIVLKLENDEISFDYSNIRKANLVFTDEEFKSLLNKK